MTALPVASKHILFLVHGLIGSCEDYKLWIQMATERFPDWKIYALTSLKEGARMCRSSVEELAAEAAKEIVTEVRKEEGGSTISTSTSVTCPLPPTQQRTLHFVGHSMGGLIIRGALPAVVKELCEGGSGSGIKLGHYISLSSPHLGGCPEWLPAFVWGAVVKLTGLFSLQLAQVSGQDRDHNGQAYVDHLSNPDREYMQALQQCKERTAVTLLEGDALIEMASGLFDETLVPNKQPLMGSCAWQFVYVDGFEQAAPFCQSLLKNPLGVPQSLQNHLKSAASPTVNWGSSSQLTSAPPPPPPPPPSTVPSTAASPPTKRARCTTHRPGIGIQHLPWRKVAVEMRHSPTAMNAHVFLIGKVSEQHKKEHSMSKECIGHLLEILAQ